jgi:hypothetical protein
MLAPQVVSENRQVLTTRLADLTRLVTSARGVNLEPTRGMLVRKDVGFAAQAHTRSTLA